MNLEQKVTEILGELSNQLGVGVDHFWPLFVREQYIDGVISLSLLPFLCIAIVWMYKKIVILNEENTGVEVFVFFAICFAIMLAISCLYSVKQIANPEYHALKSVIEMVK